MKANIPRRGLLAVLLGLSLLVSACGTGAGTGRLSERQIKAQAMFAERCKTAGEKIHRTVENVEGLYLLKIRPTAVSFDDQFRLDDPYGHDSGGDWYIKNFLRGFYHQSSTKPLPGSPPRLGYLYVEAMDPRDERRYRYTGKRKAVRKKDVNAPGVQFELRHNPGYDLNVYEFVLDKVPASGPAPRYGVIYDDISTREDREYWIAGSSLKVIDLQSNEVIAERVGYMMDRAQGSRVGGRSPLLFAADTACPTFQRNPLSPLTAGHGGGSSAQTGQTLDFVEKVLKSPLN